MLGRRLPWQTPLDSRTGDKPVRTQEELEEAIEYFRQTGLGEDGAAIRLVGVITVDSTVTIPDGCDGLLIRGPGIIAATCDTVFDCYATDVQFDNVHFRATAATTLVVLNGARSEVRFCRQLDGAVSNAGPAIDVQADDCTIMGNHLAAGIGGLAIQVGSGAMRGTCAIIGNNCGTSDIDTSGCGAGSNVIAGNTRVGTITTHASLTDQEGLNT